MTATAMPRTAAPMPRTAAPMPTDPTSPSPPRVWPVFVTYVAAFVVLVLAVAVVSISAVVGKVPRGTPPAEVARRIEAFAVSPDGIVAASLITSVTLLVVAMVGGALSAEGLLQRLRLGRTHLSWRRILLMLVGLLAIGEAMSGLVDLLGWGGKGALGALSAAMRQFSGPAFLALLMVIGLFAPVAEELFFRGFIQTRLAARFGPWPGILTTAFLFGLLHLDLVHTPLSLVLGIFLGWAAVASGTVVVPILLHIANNVTAVLLTAYLPESSPLAIDVAVFGVSFAVAAAVIWRLRGTPAQVFPRTRSVRVSPVTPASRLHAREQAPPPVMAPAHIPPAAGRESGAVTSSRAQAAVWANCPHCQLRHTRRSDGHCPRCSRPLDSMPPTPTATRDFVLEDAGRKELNAIRVLMALVSLLAIGVNWEAGASAYDRVFDANPALAVSAGRGLALVGMALGFVFLGCAAGAGRRPVSATKAALAVCACAHVGFWALDPLGGNAFFGKIDMSEPNLGAVMKVLVAIVLLKAVHTATEYQKAVDFHEGTASVTPRAPGMGGPRIEPRRSEAPSTLEGSRA